MDTKTDQGRMAVEGIRPGTDSGARSVGKRAAVVGAALGAALAPAGAAHAAVIGVGDAVFGNACVSHGGVPAAGSTASGSGTVNGDEVGLPLSLPRNHCGNSGIVCTALFGSSV